MSAVQHKQVELSLEEPGRSPRSVTLDSAFDSGNLGSAQWDTSEPDRVA